MSATDSRPRANGTRARESVGAWLPFAGVFVLVLLSRLPFLGAGYGDINDAWRVANAAREIGITGRYTASRFPPHPVQEIACSVLWRQGPLLLNGATALLSAVAVLFFALSIRRLGIGSVLPASAALALAPVIFVNSTNATDYLWALSFILGSLYFVLDRKPILSGVFLGLAIGSRITSGAMLLPLGLLLIQREKPGSRLGPLARFAGSACLVGAATFAPVFRTYGFRFFTFSEGSHPSVFDIIRRASVDLWGNLGVCAILLALAWQFLRRKSAVDTSGLAPERRQQVLLWLLTIGLYGAAFLRLPYLAAYMIPAVPFALLVLATLLPGSIFRVVCLAVVLSSFVNVGKRGLSAGPIFVDRKSRLEGMAYTQRIVDLGRRLPNPSVIVAGHWLPKVEVYVRGGREGQVEYAWLLDANSARNYRDRGFDIYFLPRQREYNLSYYGVDLAAYGAMPLVASSGGWHW